MHLTAEDKKHIQTGFLGQSTGMVLKFIRPEGAIYIGVSKMNEIIYSRKTCSE